MGILIGAALQAAGGQIGAETVKALLPLLKKCGKKVTKWLEQNEMQIPEEIPADIQEEVKEIAQQYIESEKFPVYMDGVIFFFEEDLNEAAKEDLREIIKMYESDGEYTNAECMEYDLLNYYMDGIAEEGDNFGFEQNTLYINFRDTYDDSERLFDGKVLRRIAHALNEYLSGDNYIQCFRTF